MDRRSFLGRSSGALAALSCMPVLAPLNSKQRAGVQRVQYNTKEHVSLMYELSQAPRDVKVFLMSGDAMLKGPPVKDMVETDVPWRVDYTFEPHRCYNKLTYEEMLIVPPSGRAFTHKFNKPPTVKAGDELKLTWTFYL